jgi:hypothetical protein
MVAHFSPLVQEYVDFPEGHILHGYRFLDLHIAEATLYERFVYYVPVDKLGRPLYAIGSPLLSLWTGRRGQTWFDSPKSD